MNLCRCELLSFFSIFGIQNNEINEHMGYTTVVNCFHFSVSLGYKTTLVQILTNNYQLWIAFIFQYLWDTKQLKKLTSIWVTRCELLSFFSIFGIQNNQWKHVFTDNHVVNCFHFSVSLGYKTTKIEIVSWTLELWIAFIFQYLWDTKQLETFSFQETVRCELLSFFSIFGIQNNGKEFGWAHLDVVNCFHFSVSLGYKTTPKEWPPTFQVLWIAFIFQYLWDTKQLDNFKRRKYFSCELLSFFSIFGIQNNFQPQNILHHPVVNCFHFSVSLGYKTTVHKKNVTFFELWIAFIFQYLWDTKQQNLKYWVHLNRCELLSFFSIFGIQNNQIQKRVKRSNVVNCFHFSVSLGYKTTSKILRERLQGCELLSFFSIFGIQNNFRCLLKFFCIVVNCFHFSVSLGYKTTWVLTPNHQGKLWIAFIFQYLWDTKQPLLIKAFEEASCELLSFFSIFGIQNNYRYKCSASVLVVNCFHFSVSLGYKTTQFRYLLDTLLLWIAFIFQYLWDTKQRLIYCLSFVFCCELLSFFSIFGIQNNNNSRKRVRHTVVNCFHFSVSLGYKTTLLWFLYFQIPLWIAFIFQYLWDTKQLRQRIIAVLICCELLSFFSIFGIQNNWRFLLNPHNFVVNCFHFSVSLGYKTT